MLSTDLYRLPWSLNDNVLGWLEPTKQCNIYCEGCYSTNEQGSHKSMGQLRQELRTFVARRRVDSISIAGGDPLTHPEIGAIVRMIREEFGLKPVLNTNGHAMTPARLQELKRAGLHGLTFHVDSSQSRPGWKRRSNRELNALREELAAMVAREGGLSCAFNMTVFRETLDDVPEMIRWAQEHIERVHSMVFILFRTARSREFRYFAQDREVGLDELPYYDQEHNPAPLTTPEVLARVQAELPDFRPAAFLGGTRDPDSLKWTLVCRVGSRRAIQGYLGPRFMELVQAGHHALAGRYLAYAHPALLAHGRATLAAFSPLDGGARAGLALYLRGALRRPGSLLERQHVQSIAFIQPIDMMPDGEANMCDGCPDMTVHDGQLVWSCRLDELKRHGSFLRCVPAAS